MTGTGEPFDLVAGFFLGRIIEADPHDRARGDTLGRQADDRAPEMPAVVRERAAEAHREAGKVFDGGRPRASHIGRDGMTIRGHGPPTGSQRESVPRRRSKEALKEGHDHGAKG